jgi:hypothetical protein
MTDKQIKYLARLLSKKHNQAYFEEAIANSYLGTIEIYRGDIIYSTSELTIAIEEENKMFKRMPAWKKPS